MTVWLLAALLATMQAAPDAADRPSVILRPDWAAKPDGETIGRVWPTGVPFDNSIDVHVNMQCRVKANGGVGDCVVLSTDGSFGKEFAESALRLAPFFKMHPKTEDGRPIGGAYVNIPIHFQVR